MLDKKTYQYKSYLPTIFHDQNNYDDLSPPVSSFLLRSSRAIAAILAFSLRSFKSSLDSELLPAEPITPNSLPLRPTISLSLLEPSLLPLPLNAFVFVPEPSPPPALHPLIT
mmetsp:Transcript_12630/g.15918  ORF Transcript_12630/g.15918 Transcript_12630/m.15918 type:complete len:112 (-) Transcript_12630:620-955(-)